jgi:hypothetical protein
MDTTGDGTGSRQWRLRGFWLVWIWVSWAICAALFFGGLAVAVIGATASGSGIPLTLGVAVLLLAIAGMIGGQLVATAVAVTVDADGSVVLRRPWGAVRTHGKRVWRVRPSALRSGHTATVVETADGWAYLVGTRAEREELIAALRRLNPDIVVESEVPSPGR